MVVDVEFLGNGSLGRSIAKQLGLESPVSYQVKRFTDGESYAYIEHSEQLKDKHILLFCQFEYGKTKFINDQFMSYLLTVDQLKKFGVAKITSVLPYFPFTRQDKNISGIIGGVGGISLIAKLCKVAGIDEVICCDLHTDSIKKHFTIPIHSIDVTQLWFEQLKRYNTRDICLVAPDQGSKDRVQKLAQHVDCAFSYIEKYRPQPNTSIVRKLVGNVSGKIAIIVDDILDTGGTAINASSVLNANGAAAVHGFFTHGILSGNAAEKLVTSPFEKIILTDTLIRDFAWNQELFSTVSCSELLASGISTYFSENYTTSAQVTGQHETTKATFI